MVPSLLGLGASVVGSKMLSNFTTQRIHILHAIPGRLRLQCNEWKNTDTANLVQATLTEHPFVKQATTSPITGSLVIEFTKDHLSMEELDAILKLAVDQTGQAYPLQEAKVLQNMKHFFRLLDSRMKRQTKGFVDMNTLIILFLLGSGMKNLKKNTAFSASLFFWAYSLFNHQKDKP